MNNEESVKTTIKSYNQVAKNYAAKFFADDSDRPYLDNFLKLLPENAKVLDAGCGPGNYSSYLHELGFEVVGTDLSEGMLTVARKNVPHVKFIQADLRTQPFPPNSFKGIVAAYSLIHLPTKDLLLALKHLHSLLSNKGLLYLALQEGKEKDIADHSLGDDAVLIFSCYTLEEITDYLDKANFEVVYSFVRPPNANEIAHNKLFVIARKKEI